MKADIDAAVVYRHPIERVWAALTSSEALAAWLMPNDFVPEVGHRFTLRTRPAAASTRRSPSRSMPGRSGTRLRLHQVGFHGLGAKLTRRILAGGYPRIVGRLLPAYLDEQAGLGPGTTPADVQCAAGWRSYLGLVRRWR